MNIQYDMRIVDENNDDFEFESSKLTRLEYRNRNIPTWRPRARLSLTSQSQAIRKLKIERASFGHI